MINDNKKDEIIAHKKKAIKKLDRTFEAFIGNPNQKYLKKVDLISYWIENYCEYLLKEEIFDYKKVPKFRRGDIISANFGFNIGSEHGGLHFAVVLDNDNKHSSPVITVLPLTSGSEEKVYERDVYLGQELYTKLSNKYNELKNRHSEDLAKMVKEMKELEKAFSGFKAIENSEAKESLIALKKILDVYNLEIDNLEKNEKNLLRHEKDVRKLKSGSIALIGQVTTISKMRIYKPKSKYDLLYNINLSDGAMDKINDQFKKLYVFSK